MSKYLRNRLGRGGPRVKFMLSKLLIENFAIVESAALEFERGFNVITGETGSGKSILVGAMEMAFGERASTDIIRAGSKVASVEAVFEAPFNPATRQLICGELGLEWED
ncbi:AAA family ATPase, partial [Candidatus Sumerlaeota bacterium]|nr:AAA family ATPase [Candidatus Sumerlaeota bacterium]